MILSYTTLKKISFFLTLLLGINMSSSAQENVTLSIGDKAPSLQYGKWLKGEPIKDYKEGHLYLFEFWATWCGPCIASMPHLSEFAREHKENATVIAVNVWEKTGDQPYESSTPKVARFVEQMGDKMDFNVITDTKDQFMGDNWLKAAGQSGIPTTIMVKDGTIMWMGHPIQLDSIVNLVMAGQFDIDKVKKDKAAQQAENEEKMRPFTEAYARFEQLTKDKKYEEAIALADSVSLVIPEYAGTFGFFKFMAMMDVNEDKAMKFAKEWQSTKPGYTGSTAGFILSREGLKKSTYLYGMELMKTLLDKPEMPKTEVYKAVAQGYAYMKDFKKAAEAQQEAITIAKGYLKDGQFAGFILEDHVKEMEKKLADYKQKKK